MSVENLQSNSLESGLASQYLEESEPQLFLPDNPTPTTDEIAEEIGKFLRPLETIRRKRDEASMSPHALAVLDEMQAICSFGPDYGATWRNIEEYLCAKWPGLSRRAAESGAQEALARGIIRIEPTTDLGQWFHQSRLARPGIVFRAIIPQEEVAPASVDTPRVHKPNRRLPAKHASDSGSRLKAKAKRELIMNFIQQRCDGHWDRTLKELSQTLSKGLGFKVSPSTLSRMKIAERRRRGQPHRVARSPVAKHDREAVARDEDASYENYHWDDDAFTMPDDLGVVS